MAAGATFSPGQVKIRPGAYAMWEDAGARTLPDVRDGIGAAVFRSDWGPANLPIEINDLTTLEETFGVPQAGVNTVDVAREMLLGGALAVKAVRMGTGAVAAAWTVRDNAGSPANVATVPLKYPGTRGNAFTLTVRDHPGDTSKRQALFYEGTALRETIAFPKASGDEALGLVTAINDSSSKWLGTAVKIATGSGVLGAVSNSVPGTLGVDPTIVSGDYTTAMSALMPTAVFWNVLAADTEDSTIQAAIQTFIDNAVADGKFVMAVLGIPGSITYSTRLSRAAAFNDPFISVVGEGGYDDQGNLLNGYKAAARYAGILVGTPYFRSTTRAIVGGLISTESSPPLTSQQIDAALSSGMIVFTENAGAIVVEDDNNTLVSPPQGIDDGWKSNRRVRERLRALRVASDIADSYVGKINNDLLGRQTVLDAIQGGLDAMVSAGALAPGVKPVIESDPPSGADYVYIAIDALDLQSIKKLYLRFRFRYT